jgi:hypothetical protein
VGRESDGGSLGGDQRISSSSAKRRRVKMPSAYTEYIEDIAAEDPPKKPKALMEAFRQAFPTATEVTGGDIYNKIRAIRRKKKKQTTTGTRYSTPDRSMRATQET